MVNKLVHRGPGDAGFWEGDGASLGMRRLAILDLETGQQPIFNEDRTVGVVFNGEIYNHAKLRADLEERGHRFSTDHSDTEVLVHLYEDFGTEMFRHLNGMFAIAIWDISRKRLLLARDHAGIKPLYYARTKAGLAFASEPKSLLLLPDISSDPDLGALDHYFTFKHTPAPGSAYRDVRQLCAGEFLIWDGRNAHIESWYELPRAEDETVSEGEAIDKLRTLLTDSVEMQMQSDVPLGAYLSGGLDSSAVVAIMAERAGRAIDTFTLVYDDDISGKQSDREFARQVSRLYDTNHHEQLVRASDLPSAIDAVIDAFDEPFSGVISTWFLTGLIREHVTVALSGDGADELFGSYRSIRLAAPLAAWEQASNGAIPLSEAKDVARANGFDPASIASIFQRGDAAAQRMEQYLIDDQTKARLYSPAMRDAIGPFNSEALVRDVYSGIELRHSTNRALALDFKTLLPDQVLAFVDRLSMSHSVEVRPPFLDPHIVNYVMALPGHLKIRNGRCKHILKEVAAPLLPASLIDRPKEGFLMPLNQWVADHLGDFTRDTLSESRLAKHGLLDPSAVRQLLDGTFDNQRRSFDRVWNLVMFQLWWERHVN